MNGSCNVDHPASALGIEEGGEVAVGPGEFFVASALDDTALFQDGDAIGFFDGAQAVGDGDDGAATGEVFEGGLDESFALIVEGGGGLVENENARVAQEGAGDGDALALPA